MHRLLPLLLLLGASLSASAQADTITVGALERTYTVRLPSSYDGSTALPLVIAMHGGFGSGVQLESQSQLSVTAEAEGFIVVYPDGVPSLLGIRTWNAGGCCAYAMDNNIDDVGFINALLDTLIDAYAIDTQRIYATGMSNGGFMSYRLACELSERIAAIAPVSASMTIDVCQPTRSMPVLGIHSYLDGSVPYEGGIGNGVSDHYNSPQDSVHTAFALHANCAVLNDTILDDIEMTVIRWHECDCEQEILLYMTHDGGHSWPGGQPSTGFADPPSQVLNANDLMWAFFQQYTLDCATTDVQEVDPRTLRVSPNPTTATIAVTGGDAIRRVQVLDLRGSVLLDVPMNGSANAALDVSALPKGLYALRVMDANGVRTTRFVLAGN
ncbi:MAG: T9SS type A sorting domain-containing protein [Flavobacteriales bacterium]